MNTENLKKEYRKAIKKELDRCEDLAYLDLIWQLLQKVEKQKT